MNFIFISPYFPANYVNFCAELKNNRINVLGIGDSPYDSLPSALKNVLTEYYKVSTMEDYDQMMRAVAYFTFKYGKIDWLESNNEYWLCQDARLRTDFNITTGYQTDEINMLKLKSNMKEFYRIAGIPAADCLTITDRETCFDFVRKHGYPIIVKPDNGVGAADTHRISDDNELNAFFDTHKQCGSYIAEPYVYGTICSYDAIINSKGEPIFESGNVTPVSIMEIVNNKEDSYFYIQKELPEDVRSAGRKCVNAFKIKSRFIHLEFFRLDKDMEGLGKQGDIVGLEANLRPSGGFTPDMLNYANSTNVYKVWADMIAFDRSIQINNYEKYYCIFVGRRDGRPHVHDHNDVLSKYRANITMSDRMPEVLAGAMGNQMYIAKFSEKKDMDDFLKYVLE